MRQILTIAIFLFLFTLISCGKNTVWQVVYYEHGHQEKEEYGPVFNNYEACKDWALKQIVNNDDDVHCAKNCHDVLEDGTSVCEVVVRTWEPLPGSATFENYKE